jgi:1-acyl-sn-glycerol-3-phosphate acyltransferase
MNLVYRVGWTFWRSVALAGFRCRYHHPENVPASGPAILAANHASFLDPPLVGAGLRRDLHYLARESLFRLPLFGAILRQVNVVPVDREGGGARGLKAILDRLLQGGAILLFPEGTRSPDGGLQPARSGIGLTVIKSSAPVIPVRLFGTFEAWGRHQRWPRFRRVAVTYGRPLSFDLLREEAQSCSKPRLKAIYQEAADDIMSAIAQLEPRSEPAPMKGPQPTR